jgi:CO dehydrogenase nickel-insertion accessory protein CooC1
MNKVNSEDLASKLTNELAGRGIAIIGSIPYDPEIFEACLDGQPLGKGEAAREAGKILDTLFPNEN